VRDELHRESFDDLPDTDAVSNRPFARAGDAARLRVIAGARSLPPPADVAVTPWPIEPTDENPLSSSMDHSDRWIDPPAHGWVNRVHELSLPSRRILSAVGISLVGLVVLVAVLTSGSSSPPAGHHSLPPSGTGTTQTTGWRVTALFPASSVGLSALSCPSTSACEAVGETTLGTGMVLRSTNNGTTWTQQAVPNGLEPLSSIACPSPRQCVAVGGIEVAIMLDGGAIWSIRFLKAERLTAVSCPSVNMCVVAGVYPSVGPGCDDGVTYTTTDAGSTWTPMFLKCFAPRGVSCPSVSDCVVVGTEFLAHDQYGAIFRSTDDGAWRLQYSLTDRDTELNSVSCATATLCEAVGNSERQAIVGTVDGGKRWVSQHIPASTGSASLATVTCWSAGVCSAGGGRAFSTVDGGGTWVARHVPSNVVAMMGISCSSAGTCLAVGDEGARSGLALRLSS
jgi:hypothetical protein